MSHKKWDHDGRWMGGGWEVESYYGSVVDVRLFFYLVEITFVKIINKCSMGSVKTIVYPLSFMPFVPNWSLTRIFNDLRSLDEGTMLCKLCIFRQFKLTNRALFGDFEHAKCC